MSHAYRVAPVLFLAIGILVSLLSGEVSASPCAPGDYGCPGPG